MIVCHRDSCDHIAARVPISRWRVAHAMLDKTADQVDATMPAAMAQATAGKPPSARSSSAHG
jgi:hypothetical protein